MAQLLVSLGRLYKRLINPVAHIARSFIRHTAHTLSQDISAIACIDIGAGTAPYENTLRQFLLVDSYVTVDVAPSDRTMIVADCAQLPLRSESADLVVSFDVIQHVTDPDRMLHEAVRILKPNGHVLLTFPFMYPECDTRDFRRWTVDGMRVVLLLHGLEPVLEQRRGGTLFALSCWITWMLQHLVPGQRRSWRASRRWSDFVRAGLLAVLTLPAQLLGWLALALDRLIPSRGIYMGACMLARKTVSRDAISKGSGP